MPFIERDGAKLFYQVHGEGRGRETIVFAHGRGGNHLCWWRQLPAFTDRYRCVVFDHRSFGLSVNSSPPAGQEAFAPDLAHLLDQLDIERAHLVAQSMGGRTCLDFALAYPQRVGRMVLADTIAGVVDPELADLLARFGSAHVDLLQRVLSAGFIARSPELAFLYSQVEALNHVHGAPIKLQARGPGREQLQQCKAPTLLIVGDEDKLSPRQAVEWLSRQLPSARMEVMADAGHSAYFERPEEFNRLVLAFLGEAGQT